MLRIFFESYGGTHRLREELKCVPADPGTGRAALILSDEQGYYGFVTDRAQMTELRDWLNKALQNREGQEG